MLDKHTPSYDCVIIGGGPAGSTVAALVADAGFTTLLVEREKMPRFHVGESLMPETYWTLSRLGVLDRLKKSQFIRKVGVQFVGASGRESQPFLFSQHDPRESSQTWHVERSVFDWILFENAGEKGAVCHDQTRVIDVSLSSNRPHKLQLQDVEGQRFNVWSRAIVDATGQQAFLANRLGLKVDNPNLRKAAIWGYYRGAQRNGVEEFTTILHTENKRCWFWYIPMSDDLVSVGLVGDNEDLLKRSGCPDDVFAEERRRCPGLRERLRNSQLTGPLHVAKEFSYCTKEAAGDGWVLVGDAYGFIDPIYSTGVFLALKSGEMAADCLIEGFHMGDLSANKLSEWTLPYESGLLLFRKLVGAFYTNEFSFAEFIQRHPEHKSNLTDLLIGRAFSDHANRIFQDLDQELGQKARQQQSS